MTSQSDFDYRLTLSVCEIIFHIAVSHCRMLSLAAYYDRTNTLLFLPSQLTFTSEGSSTMKPLTYRWPSMRLVRGFIIILI